MLTAIKVFLSTIRKSIMPIIVVALLVSNGLTLFYSGFHDALYSALETFVPTTWTKNSPTSKQRAKNAQIKKIKLRTKSITKKVSKRAAKGAATNLGGVFAEALPVLGIAVSVGISIKDIRDACEDMKDMQELNTILSIDDNLVEVERVCGMKVSTNGKFKEDMENKWENMWTTVFKTMGL